MFEPRVYKVTALMAVAVGLYTGLSWQTALLRAAAFMALLFLSDWLTSFVLP